MTPTPYGHVAPSVFVEVPRERPTVPPRRREANSKVGLLLRGFTWKNRQMEK